VKKVMLVALLLLGPFVLTPQSASAQGAPAGEVAGGYVFMRDFEIDTNFPLGWFASAGVNLSEMFTVVGEVSGSYATIDLFGTDVDANVHTFMGGARFVRRMDRVTPFAQVLVGLARAGGGVDFLGVQISDAVTDFAIQPGGGVDVRLTERLSARVGADYRRIFSEDADGSELRFTGGIVVGFGSR
jgi:opacity protein-like surface antigen